MAGPNTGLWVGIIALFTGIETAALALWLEFVRGEPAVSTAVAVGLGVLVAGLFVEHLLTDVAVNGVHLDFRFGAIAGFTISETVLWGVWLRAAEGVGGGVGIVIASVVLAVALVPQHTIEDNVLQGREPLGDLVDLDTAGFSLIEAAGAAIWLGLVLHPDAVGGSIGGVDAALVGLVGLGVALFVEHTIGVRFSSR